MLSLASGTLSLEAISDATLGQVVGRHLYQHFVAGEHADTVLAHAARGVGDDLVLVLELDAEGGIRQQFRHHTGKFQQLFFRHSRTEIAGIWPSSYANPRPKLARNLADDRPFHN